MQNNIYYINERIRAQQLRVLTADSQNLGILTLAEALKEARDRELDLVLIAPQAIPPVAKILDFKKFMYEERKKASAIKAKSKKSELKEVRIKPKTDMGDINSRIGRGIEWIKDGNRVKVTVIMKGREAMFPEVAFDKINKFIEGLAEVAKPESPAKRVGNMIFVVFVPK